jgi:RNAse (barnase) inhibitor barstar
VSGLGSLLDGRTRPGVYSWSSDVEAYEVRREVEDAGWRFVHLDTSGVEDKAGFLDRAAAAFGFPDWFGRNWDALADSLGDVRAEHGTLALWDGWSTFARADGRQFAIALDTLRERAESPRGGAFVVLVRAEGPEIGVPSLDSEPDA